MPTDPTLIGWGLSTTHYRLCQAPVAVLSMAAQ